MEYPALPTEKTNQPVPRRPFALSDGAIACVLVVVSLLCYGNTLKNGFVYDDGQQVIENPYIKSWHFLPKIFTSTVWSFQGEIGTSNYYRPLMTFSYLLLWQMFPDLPFGFHLFNVVLNVAVVLLGCYAGQALFRDRRIGYFSALIFAVHPVHTEAVAWVAAVPDLEATLFCLATYLYFARRPPDGWKRQIPLVCFYFLALLSKEPSLLLAPILAFYEYRVREEETNVSPRTKRWRYAPVCAMAILYLLVRTALFGSLVPVLQRAALPWPQTFLTAFALVARYTRLLFWPAKLSVFHVFHASTSLADPEVLAGIAIVGLSAAFVLFCWNRAPIISFCLLWIGFLLAPVLNARWMASNVLTDRYLYLPSIGFCWLVAMCGVKIWDAQPATNWVRLELRAAVIFMLAAVVVAGCAATIRRNRDWQSDVVLYTRTLETDPDASYIRTNLGAIYFDRRDYARAAQEWERALAGKADSVPTLVDLGLIYTREGRYTEAADVLRRALKLKPLFANAHYDYAMVLDKTGNPEQALTEYKRAVDVAPLDPLAHRWYGTALAARGRLSEAETEFTRSLELQPLYDTFQDLTKVYLAEKKTQPAENLLRKFLALYPSDAEGHFQLAQILESSRRAVEARKEYLAGLATDPANPKAKEALQHLR
jgi:protein O-mannosyl-transferase